MSEEQQLVEAGQMGDKVRAFIESDIGQLILSGADIDKAEAIKDLLELDPFAYNNLPDLQNALAKIQENVVLSGKIQGYLGDAIIRGDQADQLLMSKEES